MTKTQSTLKKMKQTKKNEESPSKNPILNVKKLHQGAKKTFQGAIFQKKGALVNNRVHIRTFINSQKRTRTLTHVRGCLRTFANKQYIKNMAFRG